jgi:hypothetical protein
VLRLAIRAVSPPRRAAFQAAPSGPRVLAAVTKSLFGTSKGASMRELRMRSRPLANGADESAVLALVAALLWTSHQSAGLACCRLISCCPDRVSSSRVCRGQICVPSRFNNASIFSLVSCPFLFRKFFLETRLAHLAFDDWQISRLGLLHNPSTSHCIVRPNNDVTAISRKRASFCSHR